MANTCSPPGTFDPCPFDDLLIEKSQESTKRGPSEKKLVFFGGISSPETVVQLVISTNLAIIDHLCTVRVYIYMYQSPCWWNVHVFPQISQQLHRLKIGVGGVQQLHEHLRLAVMGYTIYRMGISTNRCGQPIGETLGKSPTNRGANDTSILVYMRGTIPVPYNFQPFLGLKDSDQFWNSCFVPTGSRNTFGASCWSLAEYPLGIFHVAGPPWFFPWFSQLQSSICFRDVPINRRLWEILVLLGFTVGKWSINAGCSIGSEFIHWSAVCPPWSWEIAMMLLFPNKGWNPSNIF